MREPVPTEPERNAADLYREVVLVQHETAKSAHQELFSFDDSRYVMSSEHIIESILALSGQGIDKIHIAVDWEHLLMVTLWKSGPPPVFDVICLLKKAGLGEAELLPFKAADSNDLFPWLFYGKKFDVLRKICNAAKAKTESKINGKHGSVICHLLADDAARIVASSL